MPTTFGTSKRFKEHEFEYTEEAHYLSGIDYHKNVYVGRNQAPQFEKYAMRKDNFLSKSQENLL